VRRVPIGKAGLVTPQHPTASPSDEEKSQKAAPELEPEVKETSPLEKLAESSLKDIKAADLSDDEKADLLAIEKAGKNRKSVVKYLS
jgi:hypothetical protein